MLLQGITTPALTQIWGFVTGIGLSPGAALSRPYKHKAQGYTEQTTGQFTPNVILFLCVICPNQTKPNFLKSWQDWKPIFLSAFVLTPGGADAAVGNPGVPGAQQGVLLQTGNCGLSISEPNPFLFITKISLEFLP